MTLSADQTAVLELLLTGGQTYPDLDDLLGLEEGETRTRAHAAIEELGGADPDRNVGLTDYLLGQADPIGRADAVRHLRQDGTDHALATAITERLQELVPAADLPKLPAAPSGGRRPGRGRDPAAAGATAQSAGERRVPRPSRTSFTSRQARLFAALGAGAVILIAIVLGVSGVFSGEDEPAAKSSGDTRAGGGSDPSSPLPAGQEVTRVPLLPEGNGDAAGAAIVGITNDQPYLDLVIENLQPAPQDQAYIAWFMFDEDHGYPIPAPIVPEKGSFEDRTSIPAEVSTPISRAQAIEISLSDPGELVKAIEAAAKANTFAIERPGSTILRGDVPQPSDQAPQDQVAPGEGQGG